MDRPLRILHVLRAPVGGLFRHIVDLTLAQAERGHLVGVIADGAIFSPQSEDTLKSLATVCKLGVQRIPMSRHLGFRDTNAIRHVSARALEAKAEILHGHGAKGGAYARLARTNALRVYTPHGGSLHYAPASPLGLLYLNLERALARRTDLFLFESKFGADTYSLKVGKPRALARVVHNGVRPEELEPIKPDPGAADIVFVGELRKLKGVDLLIQAIAHDAAKSAILFGDGPDAKKFHADVTKRGLASRIEFGGTKPAREAFRRGRLLVVPSRTESFPYIVLEAAAASVPMIATRVGGIPEIFGPDADELIEPNVWEVLAEVIASALKNPPKVRTARLRERVGREFTVASMTDGVLKAYDEAMAARPRLNP